MLLLDLGKDAAQAIKNTIWQKQMLPANNNHKI